MSTPMIQHAAGVIVQIEERNAHLGWRYGGDYTFAPGSDLQTAWFEPAKANRHGVSPGTHRLMTIIETPLLRFFILWNEASSSAAIEAQASVASSRVGAMSLGAPSNDSSQMDSAFTVANESLPAAVGTQVWIQGATATDFHAFCIGDHNSWTQFSTLSSPLDDIILSPSNDAPQYIDLDPPIKGGIGVGPFHTEVAEPAGLCEISVRGYIGGFSVIGPDEHSYESTTTPDSFELPVYRTEGREFATLSVGYKDPTGDGVRNVYFEKVNGRWTRTASKPPSEVPVPAEFQMLSL